MSTFLKRANRTPVTAELLGRVMEIVALMPPGDRSSYEMRAIRMFELLDQAGLKGKRAEHATATDFRLTALSRHLAARGAKGWTMHGGEDGMELIHADLVRCAAEETIIEDSDGQPAFDAGSFEQRLLTIAETRGTA